MTAAAKDARADCVTHGARRQSSILRYNEESVKERNKNANI